MREKIYELWHVYEIFQDGIYLDSETFIGVFSTEEKCQAAIAELLTLGYFSERSDKFKYHALYVLGVGDEVGWWDGFVNPSESEG